jgi:hypothetical protein
MFLGVLEATELTSMKRHYQEQTLARDTVLLCKH